jgi:hypothetical protein
MIVGLYVRFCAVVRIAQMGHLPSSYENRCVHTWFAAPDVQDSRDNPLHFCVHPKAHAPECTCKCGAVERAVATRALRDEPDGMGSIGTEHLHAGQSATVEEARAVDSGLSAGAALSPSART